MIGAAVVEVVWGGVVVGAAEERVVGEVTGIRGTTILEGVAVVAFASTEKYIETNNNEIYQTL